MKYDEIGRNWKNLRDGRMTHLFFVNGLKQMKKRKDIGEGNEKTGGNKQMNK